MKLDKNRKQLISFNVNIYLCSVLDNFPSYMFISNKFYSSILIRFLYTNRCRNMFLRFRWLRFYSYLWRRSARSWVQYTTSNAIFHGNRNHRVRDGRRRFNFSRAVLEYQSNSSASRGFLIERNTMGEIRDKVRKSSNDSYLKFEARNTFVRIISPCTIFTRNSVGALCGMTTTLFGSLFSLPRTMYAMANDGLLFGFLGHVSERTQVPVLNLAISGSVSALIALLFDLQHLVEFMSIGTFLAYTIVSASVIILRYRPEKVTPLPSNAGTPSSLTSPPTEGADSNSDCNSVTSAESEVKKEERRNRAFITVPTRLCKFMFLRTKRIQRKSSLPIYPFLYNFYVRYSS